MAREKRGDDCVDGLERGINVLIDSKETLLGLAFRESDRDESALGIDFVGQSVCPEIFRTFVERNGFFHWKRVCRIF